MTRILKKDKTEFSDYLWKTFNWFSVDLAQKVKDSCAGFFGLDLDMKLFAIGENDSVLFRGDKYFVTEIKITKSLTMTSRLSQCAVNSILHEVLGKNDNKAFSMEKMSGLEAKIMTAFNEFLYSNIKKILLPDEEINKEKTAKSLCYIVFYLTTKKKQYHHMKLLV